MEEQAMRIVKQIYNNKTNCRGIENNEASIISLLNLKGINVSNITVNEVPLNWNNQVVVLYQDKTTRENRELFVGIGNDGNFHFEDNVLSEEE